MNQSRATVSIRSLILPALAVVGLLLFLDLFEPWRNNMLWRELFNLGHLPLFGVISLLLLRLTRLLSRFEHATPARYIIALAGAGLLALISEVVQIKGPRDADLFDLLRDLAGIVSFLLVRFSFDRGALESIAVVSRRKIRTILPVIAVGLVFLSSYTVIQLSAAWLSRDRAFPMLFTFEHWWENTFITADNAGVSVIVAASVASETPVNHLLQVDYRASQFTGPIFQDFYPDWSGFDSLAVTVVSLSPSSEMIRFRVDDYSSRKDTLDRFERVIELQPGRNELALALADIAKGPRDRLLNLQNVKRIVLFSASQPRREFSLQYDNFRLK